MEIEPDSNSWDASVAVPFEYIAPPPEQWWQQDALEGLSVPIGISEPWHLQLFELGKGVTQHALVVGQTGSGKTTLLHTLITSIALNYNPQEVELYLIDFKIGIEFKAYATHQLPHARVIAIASEREFGLSVLEELYQEFNRRANLFRQTNVVNVRSYREATERILPRILLIVDEFVAFFREEDKLAERAYQLLELLVRQGRSMGIHVLLSAQTLTGSAHLSRGIMLQISVRIALRCWGEESRLILSDDNIAASLLSRPGEAIYNSEYGLVEGNNVFQVAWLSDTQLEHYLIEIQNRAPTNRISPIVFDGNQPANIETNNGLYLALTAPVPTKMPRRLKAWVGEPTAIRESIAVTFQREGGKNLLIVGTDEQTALGMLVTSIISLAAQLPHIPANNTQTFSVLDFSTDEVGTPFQYLAEKLPHSVTVGHRHKLPEIINRIAKEAQRRIHDDKENPPLFLIIFGLHRARDLRLDVPAIKGDSMRSAQPAQQLTTILREGPDIGIHTLIWCDTFSRLKATFTLRTQREFILRVALQMGEKDSYNLVDSSAASKLGTHRALLYNDEKGTTEKFRPYTVPAQQWLDWAIMKLAERNRDL
jgi:energy-coupling factor transporter ATP-binding protein EcfA2